MRYFRSGNRVARVLTDAPMGEEFLKAMAQLYSVKREDWVDRPQLTRELVYTGDWDTCTESEAFDTIEKRRKRLAEYA
jgi:hypothetical protein